MATPRYMTILSIGTMGLLWSHLDILMDVRGAVDFVRPFHAAGLVVSITTATFVFHLMLGRCPSVIRRRPALQTAGYVLCVLAVWLFGLPLGDYAAGSWERAHKTVSEAGDIGYGWFYTDDSGMGHWPMSLPHVIQVALVFPMIPMLWISFAYLVLKARSSILTLQSSI